MSGRGIRGFNKLLFYFYKIKLRDSETVEFRRTLPRISYDKSSVTLSPIRFYRHPSNYHLTVTHQWRTAKTDLWFVSPKSPLSDRSKFGTETVNDRDTGTHDLATEIHNYRIIYFSLSLRESCVRITFLVYSIMCMYWIAPRNV